MSRYVVQAGWDDVPHLSEEAKADLGANLLPHQKDARMKGIPGLGSGAIYPVDESEFVIPPQKLPVYWPRAYGMDVGWKKTAVIWGAWDRESDVLYLYSEHYRGFVEPSVHASAIKARGKWIKGAIDPASRGRAQKDGDKLYELYENEGLNIEKADNSVEAGLLEVYQRISTGRLKVFSTLSHFLGEFRLYRRDEKGRIVKENDHLMDAARYLCMNLTKVASLPKPTRTKSTSVIADQTVGY